MKPLLRQGFQPFQRTKSSTRRDGDAKGHFRDVGGFEPLSKEKTAREAPAGSSNRTANGGFSLFIT